MTRITKRRTVRVRIDIPDHNHLTSRASNAKVTVSEYFRRMIAEDRRKHAAELRKVAAE